MQGISNEIDAVGYGFSYPLKINLQGGIELSTGRTNIEESIKIILRTHLGERLYRPNFGSRLNELTFESVTFELLSLVRVHIEEAIQKWEPRIILRGVTADPTWQQGRINITLNYQIRNTKNLHSMSYAFDLS